MAVEARSRVGHVRPARALRSNCWAPSHSQRCGAERRRRRRPWRPRRTRLRPPTCKHHNSLHFATRISQINYTVKPLKSLHNAGKRAIVRYDRRFLLQPHLHTQSFKRAAVSLVLEAHSEPLWCCISSWQQMGIFWCRPKMVTQKLDSWGIWQCLDCSWIQ